MTNLFKNCWATVWLIGASLRIRARQELRVIGSFVLGFWEALQGWRFWFGFALGALWLSEGIWASVSGLEEGCYGTIAEVLVRVWTAILLICGIITLIPATIVLARRWWRWYQSNKK